MAPPPPVAPVGGPIGHRFTTLRAAAPLASFDAFNPPTFTVWVALSQRALPGSSGSAFLSGLHPELP